MCGEIFLLTAASTLLHIPLIFFYFFHFYSWFSQFFSYFIFCFLFIFLSLCCWPFWYSCKDEWSRRSWMLQFKWIYSFGACCAFQLVAPLTPSHFWTLHTAHRATVNFVAFMQQIVANDNKPKAVIQTHANIHLYISTYTHTAAHKNMFVWLNTNVYRVYACASIGASQGQWQNLSAHSNIIVTIQAAWSSENSYWDLLSFVFLLTFSFHWIVKLCKCVWFLFNYSDIFLTFSQGVTSRATFHERNERGNLIALIKKWYILNYREKKLLREIFTQFNFNFIILQKTFFNWIKMCCCSRFHSHRKTAWNFQQS